MAKYGEMNKWGYFPVEPESQVAVGADIGFAGDNSVAITVERLRLPVPIEQGGVGTDLRQRLGDPYLYVRGIVIFPLRTPFDYVINHLKKIQVTLDNKVELLVDCTGSLPFAEMARNANLRFTQLSITGGSFDSVHFKGGKEAVSKSALVSELDATLTMPDPELRIPTDLPNADVLMNQLNSFKMGHSPVTGQAVWGGKRSKDDAVLALSYAVHVLRGGQRNGWSIVGFPSY